jgi:hypothetical protein
MEGGQEGTQKIRFWINRFPLESNTQISQYSPIPLVMARFTPFYPIPSSLGYGPLLSDLAQMVSHFEHSGKDHGIKD